MFFSPELLSKRDSGFGLLWLAATLGSQSAFKKLPKRSVLTADITQLCDLITEPAEPLALRLSSNLMFGVVRVYKVKQEILMSDVTNCVASLKKVAYELKSLGAQDGRLQMAQTSIRPSALTIMPDSNAGFSMDFDALVAVCIFKYCLTTFRRNQAYLPPQDWDKYLNIRVTEHRDDDVENSEQRKCPGKMERAPQVETIRQDMHTLDEYHEHLLSASFDISFNGPGVEPSSSQVEQGFDFNDNFFAFSDGIDLGEGLGDELAKELGWSFNSPAKLAQVDNDNVGNSVFTQDNDMDFHLGGIDEMPFGGETVAEFKSVSRQNSVLKTPKNKHTTGSGKENAHMQQPPTPLQALSPATSFSRLLLSQDLDPPQPLEDITIGEQGRVNRGDGRKNKRTRLLLDARTELTDEELKIARAQYLESQNLIRHDVGQKKSEKNSSKIIEELIWGVPQGIKARVLVEFWQENFKVQVEARSGTLYLHDEPPAKRRKTAPKLLEKEISEEVFYPDMEQDTNVGFTADDPFAMDTALDQTDYRRSSEDPGQGRRVSRAASIIGGSNFGIDLGGLQGSQRSSLFPWDNAAASSSSGNVPHNFPGSQDIQVDHVEVRLRGSSQSRRESPLIPNHLGSVLAGPGLSPAPGSQAFYGEDYGFDVDKVAQQEETQETQKSDLNLVTLERNSFNFLEYAKMQFQTLSGPDVRLMFNTVVPTLTSTRHVAAAAFYHCLVLATKDLIRLEQQNAYDAVGIAII